MGMLLLDGETVMALLSFLKRRRVPKNVPMNEARARVNEQMAWLDYRAAQKAKKDRRRQEQRRLKEPTAGI
jgi:hypothetical protein